LKPKRLDCGHGVIIDTEQEKKSNDLRSRFEVLYSSAVLAGRSGPYYCCGFAIRRRRTTTTRITHCTEGGGLCTVAFCGGGMTALPITVGIGTPSAEAPVMWTRRGDGVFCFVPLFHGHNHCGGNSVLSRHRALPRLLT